MAKRKSSMMGELSGVGEVEPTSIANALAKSATARNRTKSTGTRKSGKSIGKREHDRQLDELLKQMRSRSSQLRNPIDVEKIAVDVMSAQFDQQLTYIEGSSIGSRSGSFQNANSSGEVDEVQKLLMDVQDVANGSLGGVGSLVGGSTMDVAQGIASGAIDTTGEVVDGILGDGAAELAKSMMEDMQERGLLGDAIGAVANTATTAASAISQTASAVANTATSAISSAASAGSQALGSAAAVATGAASSAIQSVSNAATSMVSSALGAASSIASSALDAVGDVADALGGASDAT